MAHPFAHLDTVNDPDEDLSQPRFVMDFSLCRVAKQLRLLGYDAVCDERLRHQNLLAVAQLQRRIIVTGSPQLTSQIERHNRLAARIASQESQEPRAVTGYNSEGESVYDSDSSEHDNAIRFVHVHSADPHEVCVRKVFVACGLTWNNRHVFSRCVFCNRLIKDIPKQCAEGKVHPTVFRVYANFYQCPECGRVYWGMDGDVFVNYKALRTVEHLRSMVAHFVSPDPEGNQPCPSSRYPALPPLKRHFLSFPRVAKGLIFSFLPAEDLSSFVTAFPAMRELAELVHGGGDSEFQSEKMGQRKGRVAKVSSRVGHRAARETPK